MDIVERNKQSIDIQQLEKELGIPIVPMNARLGKGVDQLKERLANFSYQKVKKIVEKHEEKDPLDNTIERFDWIKKVIAKTVKSEGPAKTAETTKKIDSVFTHSVWGFVIFLFILFLIFQAIFSWSTYPMDWIENGFMVFGIGYLIPCLQEFSMIYW